MVQGSLKASKNASAVRKQNANAAKFKKREAKAKEAKKGSTLKLPKGKFREAALDDRELTKEIGKDIERKVASKLIQGGGRLELKDVYQKGKEINKELRRNEVKKKLTRVEEKLKELKEKAEREGLV